MITITYIKQRNIIKVIKLEINSISIPFRLLLYYTKLNNKLT